MGAEIKAPKNPQGTQPKKIFSYQVIKICRKQISFTLFAQVRARICGNYNEFSPTSIKPPQKILAKFSYPKNPAIENFKSKKSFDNPRHLKFEVECGTKPERAGKNKEGGEGEGKEGRVSFVLSPSPRPTPLLFLLLNPLCPVPTI